MRQALARDPRGYFRRDIGWHDRGEELPDQQRWRQPRFLLGKSREEAEGRSRQLERVWAGVKQMWRRNRETDRPIWTEATLAVAHSVARGEDVAVITIPDDVTEPAEWLDRLMDAMPIRLTIGQTGIDRITRVAEQAREEARQRRAELAAVEEKLAEALAPALAVPRVAERLSRILGCIPPPR